MKHSFQNQSAKRVASVKASSRSLDSILLYYFFWSRLGHNGGGGIIFYIEIKKHVLFNHFKKKLRSQNKLNRVEACDFKFVQMIIPLSSLGLSNIEVKLFYLLRVMYITRVDKPLLFQTVDALSKTSSLNYF